jgi:hypothetical protein
MVFLKERDTVSHKFVTINEAQLKKFDNIVVEHHIVWWVLMF